MNSRIKMSDLPAQLTEISANLSEDLAEFLLQGDYIRGPEVSNFESDFGDYVNAKHCVGVANGTDAIEIALTALNLPPGSKVLVPNNTFYATAEAVLNSGLELFLTETQSDHLLDVNEILRAVEAENIKCVVFVHLYGVARDLSILANELSNRGVFLIEDCAQASGTRVGKRHVGTYGTFGTFSFFPGKNLGAVGDGGAIIGQSAELMEKCRRIANHGRLLKSDHEMVGRNSRLDSIQAFVLRRKLRALEVWNSKRRDNADLYFKNLADLEEVFLPKIPEGVTPSYHQFVIWAKNRDGLRRFLEDQNIESAIHYPMKISQILERIGLPTNLTRSNDSDDDKFGILSLPVAEHLQSREINRVCQTVRAFYLDSNTTSRPSLLDSLSRSWKGDF